ncbi:hypothetical protein H8711_08805 [Clostridiaceae bacterium NSJ-31]|uniref:Cell shape-determining protein n=1 Tax=Ligaoa zhengdingensis TaxID=2763658 RepID=A0A926E0Q3_9FIRM|nr:hypothetical protein [Ligaoa zhengdingensis]MBC8547029.1 hypothetical protein [Ligaoa zhengdingensis]
MKKVKAILFSLITLFVLGYIFFEAPNLNPLYAEGAMFYCAVVTIYVLVWALLKFGTFTLQSPENSGRAFNYVQERHFPKWVKVLLAAPWVFFVAMLIGSSVLFHWTTFRDQLGQAQITEFSSDVQPVDVSQLPIVDRKLALKLADKKLGERQSLGSQVVLGEPTIQRVDGKLIWAVPLHHSGIFKWLTNLQGTPGYIVVSATNVKDVEYVDGKYVKYQTDSYLLNDVKRKIRMSGYLFEGLADYSFELDDSGQPYWVVSTYRNQRGFSLPEATGVILLNATTGEISRYHIGNVPEWVDRVQPEDFIINQINNQGQYVHGIFNFSDKDKFRSSEGHMIVYNNDRCYLFTGLTSVGQDDSTIGYVMVDMVDKSVRRYVMNGATENAAMSSAQGKVQNLRYTATFPLIINVGSEPTYFMTLKDDEGLIKQYAMVSVTDYSIVGTGETVPDAMRDYQQAMKNVGMRPNLSETDQALSITGTVLRIASEFNGTSTEYKLILAEAKDMIYLVDASLSDELALTQPGDRVKIEYYQNPGSSTQAASGFDNLEFSQAA